MIALGLLVWRNAMIATIAMMLAPMELVLDLVDNELEMRGLVL